MLINNNNNNNHVKFIKYSGTYPNLCRGVLTLEIDNKVVNFGHDSFDYINSCYNDNNYDEFWRSGGCIARDYVALEGEWIIDVDEIPEEYRKYAAEIDEVFNDNVIWGCCGGCI